MVRAVFIIPQSSLVLDPSRVGRPSSCCDPLDTLAKTAKELTKTIKAWEEILIQPKSQSNDDVINFVNKLSANLIFLKGEMESNIPYITEGQLKRYEELHGEWKALEKQKQDLLANGIKNFNEACRKANWDFVGFEN